MGLNRAEASISELDLAEIAHVLRDARPDTMAQINKLLDDPVTLESIAKLHSSLLVRMLAARLRAAHLYPVVKGPSCLRLG